MSRQLGSKYVLQESIGRGAMGEVFRGHDNAGHELAFKLLHPDMAGDPQLVSRFVQERSILLSVTGRNLVEVVDLVVEGQTLAIVMELVPGADLRALLKKSGTLAPALICEVGAGIATGLAVVHEANIIHRDIKPENVLIAMDNGVPVPKVTDFGVSSLVDSERARSTMLVGTPQYIAPEASEGGAITAASDLYALGIVLYELACGVTPFAGGSVMAVLRRHSSDNAGRPEGIPDELWDLISWLLAKNPAQRPPSARQVATILEALAPSLRQFPPAPRLSAPPAPAPSLGQQGAQPPAASGSATTFPPTAALPYDAQQRTSFPPVTPATAAALAAGAQSFPPAGAGGSIPGTGFGPAQGAAPEPPKKSRKGLWIALIALFAVILLAGGSLVVMNLLGNKGGNNLAGTPSETAASPAPQTTPSAESTPEQSASSEPSDLVRPGHLANYVGMKVSDVQKLLVNVSTPLGDPVTAKIVDKFDTSVSDGTVLSQLPLAGEPATGEVTLTVARSAVIAYLDDQSPVAGSWRNNDAVTISGQTYAHSVGASVCSSTSSNTVEYNLGRNYERFTASAGLSDDSADSSAQILLEVFADGHKVYSETISYGKAFTVDADMTGVLRMKIQWQSTSCGSNYNGATLALGQAKLLGVPGKAPVESPAP